jgi:hypothetical protein
MPWNEADRERYNIVRERYTSDLSDEEYALIEPLLPQPKRRGRKPTPARTILNAIFYLARCACPWRHAKGLSALRDRAKSILSTAGQCVGWAKQPGANAFDGVPTIRREDIRFKKGRARRRCAFAHPTDC